MDEINENPQAALFSAVVTAFVIESYKELSPDSSDPSTELLRQLVLIHTPLEKREAVLRLATNTSSIDQGAAVRINCFWFASLLVSLSTAFLAILAKQWVNNINDFMESSPQLRGLQRQHRLSSCIKWKLGIWLEMLPVFLHIALLLFFIGLVEFTSSINNSLYIVTITIVALTGAVYIVTHFLSLTIISCPYKTSLTISMLTLQDFVMPRFCAAVDSVIHVFIRLVLWTWKRIAGVVIVEQRWGCPAWLGWRRRERLAIMQNRMLLNGAALAWIIPELIWLENAQELMKELCRIFDALRWRSLFIDAGAVPLLAHELMKTMPQKSRRHSSTSSGVESDAAQHATKMYSATLVRMATESCEVSDPKSPFAPNGVYDFDVDDRARSHLVSSYMCDITALEETSDITARASMLRLHVFCIDDGKYPEKLVEAVKDFLKDVPRLFDINSHTNQEIMVIINTIVYIGMRHDLLPKRLNTGVSIGKSTGAQTMELGALCAVIQANLRQGIDITMCRQFCWSLWALSTDDNDTRGKDILIPIFAHTSTLSRFVSDLLTDGIRNLAVFEEFLGLLAHQVSSLSEADNVDDQREYIELLEVFVDKFPIIARDFCDFCGRLDCDGPECEFPRSIFRHIVNLWYFALFRPFYRTDSDLPNAVDIDATPLFEMLKRVHEILATHDDFFRLGIYQAACRVTQLYILRTRISNATRNDTNLEETPPPMHISLPSPSDMTFENRPESSSRPGRNFESSENREFDVGYIPELISESVTYWKDDVAQELVNTLSFLHTVVSLQAGQDRRWRMPPDTVIRGFMHIFTDAVQDTVSHDGTQSIHGLLSSNGGIKDIQESLTNLVSAKVPGTGAALNAFKERKRQFLGLFPRGDHPP